MSVLTHVLKGTDPGHVLSSGGDSYNKRLAATDEYWRNFNATQLFGLPGTGQYGGGIKSLLDTINNPGQTDSALFNQSLASNSKDTNQQVDALRGDFSRRGLGGSSLAAAFQQATMGAGSNRQAALTAQEARRREELRRSDLDMLYKFILQPNMARYANDRGVASNEGIANSAQKSQTTAAGIGALGTLIGALA